MTENQTQNPEPLVVNIKENPEPIKIQSLCIACGKNGQTILLLTKIPFFRQMLIGSFSCDQCGNRNNQIQFVGQLPHKGISISLKVTERSDLDRDIIKSEHATIRFQQIGLQIPESKKSEISTIEGILSKVLSDLSEAQQDRKTADHQSYLKIKHVIDKIHQYLEGKSLPFTVTLRDPSGNSNIKNPFAPKLDQRMFINYFTRNMQQITKMGYSQENAQQNIKNEQKQQKKQEQQPILAKQNENLQNKMAQQEQQNLKIKHVDFNNSVTQKDFMQNQLSVFEIICHACAMPGLMKLCQTNIPHFTDLVIMSFSCDFCGAHSTQTKNSGSISDKSTTLTLKVNSPTNLKRDLFKSQTSYLNIPQLGVQLDYGTLGGAYTTVEGLLQKIQDHMLQINPFTDSDSDFAVRIRQIVQSLQQMRNGSKQFTLILKDPLSNSFIQNPYHPQQDKDIVKQVRDRNQQQKDFLGINQMCV